jgi:LysR family transcriptional activator of nhaA
MEWLNYHHLRYFWTVARHGSLRKAAEALHVSQPSISAQIRLLEEALGEPLFRRSGRGLALTEAGQLVLTYADDIFSMGRELLSAVKQRPGGGRPLRLQVGITDSLPKLIAYELLKPAFRFSQPVHLVCREGAIGPLLGLLGAHRLDVVLADEPASSGAQVRAFNHRLGRSSITFCAAPPLAAKLRKHFPGSLQGAPALLPSENMALRSAVEKWFDDHSLQPQIVAEFEDSALMDVAAAAGLGFSPVHSVVIGPAVKHWGLKAIAEAEDCSTGFFAITADRRLKHPAAVAITEHALSRLFA